MRTSATYYPEYITYTCRSCWADHDDVKVDSIEDDDVCVYCPDCGEPEYIRIFD